MKIVDIDPETKEVAVAKRREMEQKFLQVRLKRCEKGQAITSGWIWNWREHIDQCVAKAVEEFLSRRDALHATRYKRPTAPASTKPASQVAQTPEPHCRAL